MNASGEVRVLRQLILDDERALEALERREVELLRKVEAHDFHMATTQEQLLSDRRLAETRLEKNRLQLSNLAARAEM